MPVVNVAILNRTGYSQSDFNFRIVVALDKTSDNSPFFLSGTQIPVHFIHR